MRRVVAIVLCVELGAGCVDLPEEQDLPVITDASAPAELVLDGGLQRPPVGKPYEGPQCATEAPQRDGGGGAFGPLDGAIAMAGADGGEEPLAPPDPADAATDPGLPRPAQAGEVVITEIMFDPAGRSDDDGEWIELWNALDGDALSLEGCVLDDGGSTPRKLGALEVQPLDHATIARGADAGFVPELVVALTLTNTSDTVALLCDGVEIDRVTYDKSFSLRAGASLSLDPTAYAAADNDDPAAWCAGVDDYGGDRGSPGALNPSCTAAAVDAGSP